MTIIHPRRTSSKRKIFLKSMDGRNEKQRTKEHRKKYFTVTHSNQTFHSKSVSTKTEKFWLRIVHRRKFAFCFFFFRRCALPIQSFMFVYPLNFLSLLPSLFVTNAHLCVLLDETDWIRKKKPLIRNSFIHSFLDRLKTLNLQKFVKQSTNIWKMT